MSVRALLLSMVSNWVVGMVVALILLVPALKLLILVLRTIFWLLGSFQAITVGAELPDFWAN